MEYTRLGRTGLKVSRLCLGTMNFGPLTTEPDSYAIMDKALDMAINFFDSADVYGWKLGEGVTEQIVGRWWAQGGGRREKVVIATKSTTRWPSGPTAAACRRCTSSRPARPACAGCKTDYIDLYQMHHIDRECPWEEIWQAMEQLVREGKVLYVGSSNFAGWHIAQANEQAAKRHFMGLVSEQSLYNLNARTIELEVIPACQSYGLGLIPWSPLAGGLLGGVLEKAKEGRRAGEGVQKALDKHRARIEAYEALCHELGEHPADVALAWLLHQPAVTAPIIGPRTMDQLTESARALEIKLSAETLKTLDELFPGPGGHAPEAYAW